MEKNDSTKAKSTAADVKEMTETQKLARLRLSAYNLEQQLLTIKEDHPLIHRPNCIGGFGGIDLSGASTTGSSGRMTWRLSNFLCPPENNPPRLAVDFPISFVATPVTDKPCYITATFKAIETQPNDLIIEVYSWDRQGEPVPFLSFYWRCRIPITPPIL